MARMTPAIELDERELLDLTPAQRIDRQSRAILAHRPVLTDRVIAVSQTLAGSEATLPLRLIELVRLRIAYWNQCRSCMSVRYLPDEVSEQLVCSLEQPQDAEDLSPAEKAALRFADLMATDHLAIDDEVYDELRRHFSEGEIVELGINCAQYVGYGRLTATWALHEHLHERYRSEQQDLHTPWGVGALR